MLKIVLAKLFHFSTYLHRRSYLLFLILFYFRSFFYSLDKL